MAKRHRGQPIGHQVVGLACAAATALLLLAAVEPGGEAPVRAPDPLPAASAATPPMGAGAAASGAVLSAARTIVFAYDAAGRLTGADYGGATRVAYGYDPAGNLTGVTTTVGSSRLYLPLVTKQFAGGW